MTFTRAVALESVVLTNEVGQQIPRRSTLPVDPVEAVRFPVPISLRPGSYTVAWRAADMDHAHGSFSFRVAAPGGRIPQPMPMSHHH